MADITFKKKKDIVEEITSRNKTKTGAVSLDKPAPFCYNDANRKRGVNYEKLLYSSFYYSGRS